MQPVFLSGPWADAPFSAWIAGADIDCVPAVLPGYTLRLGADGLMPVLAAQQDASCDGVIVYLDAPALHRLAAVHAVFHALPVPCAPVMAHAPLAALSHMPPVPTDGADWQLSDWTPNKAAVIAGALSELARLAGTHQTDALRARWPMALSHSASVLRGRDDLAPASQRGDWGRDDVALARSSQPYAWYFGVREDDLRFRRFDGSLSPEVKRAALVMSDAVTVLPYDPVRDRVMVVEQFRYGPWLRGVRNPWSLEPIAGRVDPFEAPQDAALREAQEEARLVLHADRLELVGHVYPSPGAITEFLYQYVALCDLPDGAEGVSGLETEAEDIRSHVISFDRLMALVSTGEVQNGPLVLTAYWLAVHRARLRG